jgi:hypothetical protein
MRRFIDSGDLAFFGVATLPMKPDAHPKVHVRDGDPRFVYRVGRYFVAGNETAEWPIHWLGKIVSVSTAILG